MLTTPYETQRLSARAGQTDAEAAKLLKKGPKIMKRLLFPFAFATVATPAFAHLDPAAHGSFMAGATHPLFGVDHVLAMVAVGLWAGLSGGHTRWAAPASFVGMMTLGFVMALGGIGLPLVEPMILASSIILGVLVAAAVKLDIRYSAAIVGLFAVFHGHAHGGELGQAGAVGFGAGFVLATAALHAAGLALGLMAAGMGHRLGTGGMRLARVLGGVMAAASFGVAIA